ncbi:hypothetical protein NQ317_007969 [Molorchus minor]|uniref:Rab-GAP TBC domain-containing protein n=1 Tax=Molorchus minor TaxID=1323400 RepID=A0ABQ9JI05_9CUCU|nr:hypothetical protein NQ317_007969 [Molorchus minor]
MGRIGQRFSASEAGSRPSPPWLDRYEDATGSNIVSCSNGGAAARTSGMLIMPSVLEEVVDDTSVYTPLVDSSGITGRKQDIKHLLRNNSWPANNPIRKELWPLLCTQHQNGKSNIMDGFYWDMVNQVFGSTDLPDKPISLPPFVEPSHCPSYYMTRKGRCVTDRVVSVLGYACPDIVYSPTIYPICALLLHYMSGETLGRNWCTVKAVPSCELSLELSVLSSPIKSSRN